MSGPTPIHPPRIFLRPARVAQVLGADLPVAAIEKYLVAIGCTVLNKPDDARLAVDVARLAARSAGRDRPDRGDRPAARLRQLPHRPAPLPRGPAGRPAARSGDHPGAQRAGGPWAARGGDAAARAGRGSRRRCGCSTRSPARRPGSARRCCRAWSARWRPTGRARCATCGCSRSAPASASGGDGGRPVETMRVAGVVTGARTPAHWSDGGVTAGYDLWDLKALFEAAVALANPSAEVHVDASGWVARSLDGPGGGTGPAAGDRATGLGRAGLRFRARAEPPPRHPRRASRRCPRPRAPGAM